MRLKANKNNLIIELELNVENNVTEILVIGKLYYLRYFMKYHENGNLHYLDVPNISIGSWSDSKDSWHLHLLIDTNGVLIEGEGLKSNELTQSDLIQSSECHKFFNLCKYYDLI